MRYKFILFEGVDGTGKTTLARELALKIKYKYVPSPTKGYRVFKKVIDLFSSYRIRYLYYFLGNVIASGKFKKMIERENLVCDQYVYSTAAYHSELLKRKFILPKNLLQPDLIIYTYASFEVIKKRLDSRSTKNKYEDIEFLKRVDKRYREYLKKENVIYLDTGKDDVTATINKLTNLLTS